MKSYNVITALILMLPGLSWGPGEPDQIPEPGILPLLAAGGIVALAIKFMKRKK